MYSSQVTFTGPSIPLRVADRPDEWDSHPIDALPVIPDWASHGLTWAPDVRRLGDGYVMYMTAQLADVEPATQCIGVAVADTTRRPLRPPARPPRVPARPTRLHRPALIRR